jgi:hypothetical protein
MRATLLAVLLAVPVQDEKKDLQANLSVRGKLLFSDDFQSGPLSKEWKVAKGKWEVVDGAMKGVEVAADMHAAVVKHPIAFKDIVLQFSFKLEGAKRATCSFDGKGHVCRVILSPAGFTLQKDGTKDGAEKPSQLGKGTIDLKPGAWHRMLIEIRGKEMLAQVDDQVFAFGEHAGIEQDKASFGFPVSGEALIVDDVKVWEALPNPDWSAAKEKLARKP